MSAHPTLSPTHPASRPRLLSPRTPDPARSRDPCGQPSSPIPDTLGARTPDPFQLITRLRDLLPTMLMGLGTRGPWHATPSHGDAAPGTPPARTRSGDPRLLLEKREPALLPFAWSGELEPLA